MATAAAGHVEDHAHIPALARAAGAGHIGCQRFRRSQPAGEHERPRAVVDGGRVVGMVQVQRQQDLRQLVTAGGELVFHLPLRGELGDF